MKHITVAVTILLFASTSFSQTFNPKQVLAEPSLGGDAYLIGAENMDDDPALEIVVISHVPLNPFIHIFDGETGKQQWISTEFKLIKLFEFEQEDHQPIVNVSLKDVDADGKAELVFLGARKDGGGSRLQIMEF